jgi:hypothetical protein
MEHRSFSWRERRFQLPDAIGVDPFGILSHRRSERITFVGVEGNLQQATLEWHTYTASTREIIEVLGVHVSRREAESPRASRRSH